MTSQLRTVSTNLGPATVLPTEYFLDHILPPLHSSIDLKKVIQKLKTYGRKSHRPITKAGRWWGFPKNPQDVDHYEGRTAYQHFPRIVRAIAKCGAPKGVKPGLQFVLDPEYQNEPDERQEATLPNAYMVPPEMDASSARWMEISVFGEYDKYRTAEQHVSAAFVRKPLKYLILPCRMSASYAGAYRKRSMILDAVSSLHTQ